MKVAETAGPSPARLVCIGGMFVLAPSLAWSYIDPGNGAYMVQALFTIAGAALFYLRHPLRSARQLMHWVADKLSKKSTPAGAELGGDSIESEP